MHLPKGIYINRQYSEATEKERRKLHPILRAARKNENYRGKCKMEGPALIIKGRNYTSGNLHQLPDDINGYRATSRLDENEKVIGFFGELNPLSNFHLTQFNINGINYHSSEQFIQHQKCVLFADKGSEKMVLTAETPLECKTIARNIINFDPAVWKDNAKACCTPGILAKFEQNPWLSKLLISTNGYKLVESCNDKEWGTGVPLHVPNALKSQEWHSQVLLGEILETVRNIITSPTDTDSAAMEVSNIPVQSEQSTASATQSPTQNVSPT